MQQCCNKFWYLRYGILYTSQAARPIRHWCCRFVCYTLCPATTNYYDATYVWATVFGSPGARIKYYFALVNNCACINRELLAYAPPPVANCHGDSGFHVYFNRALWCCRSHWMGIFNYRQLFGCRCAFNKLAVHSKVCAYKMTTLIVKHFFINAIKLQL